MRTLKNLEVIWKTWKNLEKTSGNPVNNTFKVALQYLFIVFALFKTVFYVQFQFY